MRTHGVRGLLRVATYLRDSRALGAMTQAVVDGRAYAIESALRIHDGWLVALRGITTREQAQHLRGKEIHALRSELPPLEVDEWYLADLVGLRAVRTDGQDLGVVDAVCNFGAGDILVLRTRAGPRPAAAAEERMVVLNPGVLREVRLIDGVVVIAPPDTE